MKLLAALLLFLKWFGFQSHAPIWVQPNAVWHYDYWVIGGQGFVKIEHIGDSVIQGKSTMMLGTTDYQFSTDQFGDIVFNGAFVWDTNYVYADGDTVFYFQNNQFQKLFDFSQSTGESYLIGETDGNDMCSTSSYTEVTGIGIDGLGYPFISLNSPDTSDLRLYGDYNKRFGGGQFLLPQRFWCDPQIIPEYYSFEFKCFQDDGMFYNPSGEDCEYLLTHLGLNEANQPNLNLFPNPAENSIKIQSECNSSTIIITNLNGEIIVELENITNNDIDISFLSPGIYLLNQTTIDGNISISRFVKK